MREAAVKLVNEWLTERARKGRSPRAAEAYLSGLGDAFVRLRKSFRKGKIVADYSDAATVDAYLFGYFPHYVATASRALSCISKQRYRHYAQRGLKIVFVGGGPLPEVVALAEILAFHVPGKWNVDILLIDTHAETWRTAVAEAANLARRMNVGFVPNITTIVYDVRTAFDAQTLRAVAGSDIVMFQNCLNEIIDGPGFKYNCIALANGLRNHGAIVVSDLDEYPVVRAAVAKMRTILNRRLQIIREFEPTGDRRSPFAKNVPTLIYRYFYGATRVDNVDSSTGYSYTFTHNEWPRTTLSSSAILWERAEVF